MQSAIPVRERPARNALTVELSYANHMRKLVADAALSSARLVCHSIMRSPRSLLWQVQTEKGKALDGLIRALSATDDIEVGSLTCFRQRTTMLIA
jgi:hypothetical protein